MPARSALSKQPTTNGSAGCGCSSEGSKQNWARAKATRPEVLEHGLVGALRALLGHRVGVGVVPPWFSTRAPLHRGNDGRRPDRTVNARARGQRPLSPPRGEASAGDPVAKRAVASAKSRTGLPHERGCSGQVPVGEVRRQAMNRSAVIYSAGEPPYQSARSPDVSNEVGSATNDRRPADQGVFEYSP